MVCGVGLAAAHVPVFPADTYRRYRDRHAPELAPSVNPCGTLNVLTRRGVTRET